MLKPETITTVRQFLQTSMKVLEHSNAQRLGGYLLVHDFVLRHGSECKVSVKPVQMRPGIPKGRKQECFYNAALLAMEHRNLTYVEGFAAGMFPTAHAWCIDETGEVIDNTWPAHGCVGTQYYGVAFDLSYVRTTVCTHGPKLIDDWDRDWPLLQMTTEQLAKIVKQIPKHG